MNNFQAKAIALADIYARLDRRDDHRRKHRLRHALDWGIWRSEDPADTSPVVTQQGTVMQRFRNKAGKQMGNYVYIHRNYSYVLPEPERVYKAGQALVASHPKFAQVYNCIRYDLNRGLVRFDEAPEFDLISEPAVGNWVVVDPEIDRVIQEGCTVFIWHHKWMWVMNDYDGFDVRASRAWSRMWLRKISSPSGSKNIWLNQIKAAGL